MLIIMSRETPIVWLIFLYCVIFAVDCKLLDNVCHKDDLGCLHPNIDATGKLVHGKCLAGNTLRRHLDISLLECVRECMVTSQCTGINYRKNWKICDVTSNLSGTLVNELECVYSDIGTWSKGLGGQCYNYNCPEGKSCIVDEDGHPDCKVTYCKDLPVTPNAICIEKFGLYRNIGSGNKFSCNENSKLEGRPFAVCQSTGEWTNLFSCILLSNVIVCENQEATIRCPAPTRINVKQAIYGRTDGKVCPHESIKTTQCRSSTSDELVKAQCNNLNICILKADHIYTKYGDPCPYTYKYLEVKYECS